MSGTPELDMVQQAKNFARPFVDSWLVGRQLQRSGAMERDLANFGHGLRRAGQMMSWSVSHLYRSSFTATVLPLAKRAVFVFSSVLCSTPSSCQAAILTSLAVLETSQFLLSRYIMAVFKPRVLFLAKCLCLMHATFRHVYYAPLIGSPQELLPHHVQVFIFLLVPMVIYYTEGIGWTNESIQMKILVILCEPTNYTWNARHLGIKDGKHFKAFPASQGGGTSWL